MAVMCLNAENEDCYYLEFEMRQTVRKWLNLATSIVLNQGLVFL